MSASTHDHGHEHEHHIMPLKEYIGVYLALLVLTVITVLVSFANLGAASLPVAMLVAVVKAALVAGYFMHLKYDDKFNAFIFAGTLLFVFLFFIFTFLDLQSRDLLVPEAGNMEYFSDQEWIEELNQREAAKAAEAAGETGAGSESAPAPGGGDGGM